ncbi:hypothetical protein [Calidifontibacillus oryziterrae]|uniref:hypothetical protein n=1 Tax=Calidifontibacillus oryziterrae TaxID=1191699 RepID=UPI00031B5795|nr:hypothetical protein [Calidifontibacillus oryziterrae]
MSFKTSVNIRFDVGKDEFILRYIPTQSHAEVLKGLLDGFVKDSNRSHIIVGPYGTGKSLIATVISTIVSKSASSHDIEKLINKFKHFDDYIADQIRKASEVEKKYLPVLLTGNEGRFRQAILSNIIKSLKKEGLDVVLPGVSKKIIEAVDKWRTDYPETFSNFISLLKDAEKSIDSWIEDIRSQNEEEIKFFYTVFPSLTSGAAFEAGYNEAFLTQMEHILEVLDKNNLGLIIVHDEFGRFLQGINRSSLNETMQDIQDLAELTNRTKSLQFMLITHKSLRQYFTVMHEDVAKEFQRIEKRFRQYNIVSDQATFLKIAEVILTENLLEKPSVSEENFAQAIHNLKKYPLFPSLNPSERESVIARSMYPLHPVALYVLPELSSVFGQNERTLFTFLESEETGGLINHISKTDNYYFAYQLFDYFFSDATESDLDTSVAEHLLLYKKAIARIPDKLVDKKIAMNLIKFISTWNLCGLQKEQKLSTEFLLFAMQMEEEFLQPILEILSKQKVIRFNILGELWEIHSGSTIDLQDKIAIKKSEYIATKSDIMKGLQNNLSKKYYFAERYNDEKDMTRFAKVELILESDLVQFNLLKRHNTGSDLNIYYVIPEEMASNELESEITKLPSSEKDIFAIHPKPLSSILNELYDSNIIESLMTDKELLSEDKGIKEELILLLKEANHVIKKYLVTLSDFAEEMIWVTNKNRKQVLSEIQLSELLTDKCNSLYSETPQIINDSFNRMNASSQQKVGAKTLIDAIIKNPTEERFGIEGSGPAYAIYASIFKNNANFDKNVNNFDYKDIEYAPYSKLREKLIKLLDEKPRGNFADVVDVFTGKPFGIRTPVIPILLVAMLRDRWNEFLLYRNEIFVPGLSGDKLYEILEEEGAENYQYVYEQIDEKFIMFFNNIENYFSNHIEERLEGVNNSRLIQICGTLIKWLRSLPRFTQISTLVNKEFSLVRDIIRKTEVKPQEAISELYDLFNNEKFIELLRVKEYAECFINEVKSEIGQEILETTGTSNLEELLVWANNKHEYLKKTNELVKSILSVNDNEKWIDNFLESFAGVLIEDWSDKTVEKFKREFKQNYKAVIDFKEVEENEGNKGPKEEAAYIKIGVGEKTKVISKVDFSVKTNTVYSNIDRIIRNAGRNIPKGELEYMIYLLLEKYVD